MNAQISTYPQPQTDAFWHTLSNRMSEESGILQTRTTPEALRHCYEQGLAVVLVIDKNACGYMAAWPVGDGMLEIGSGYIVPEWRGCGFGVQLYQAIANLPVFLQAIGFAITQNPVALSAGRKVSLLPHTDWNSPVPYALTCGACDWVADEQKSSCEARNHSCILRILHRK